LAAYRAVVLPGTKNTRQDLRWLVNSGWVEALTAYKENGGYILGICGGYQMLGHKINDPEGLEGNPGNSQCLMFLPVETTLTAPKTTTRTEFSWKDIKGKGYEIHMGKTVRMGDNLSLRVSTGLEATAPGVLQVWITGHGVSKEVWQLRRGESCILGLL